MVRHGTRFWWLAFSALLLVVASSVDAKKAATPAPAPSPPPKAGHSHGAGAPQGEAKASPGKEAEPVIEEVTAKQLERVLNEKDFVAVFWCKSTSPIPSMFQPISSTLRCCAQRDDR